MDFYAQTKSGAGVIRSTAAVAAQAFLHLYRHPHLAHAKGRAPPLKPLTQQRAYPFATQTADDKMRYRKMNIFT